jgi:hypothetical protein
LNQTMLPLVLESAAETGLTLSAEREHLGASDR